MNGANKHLVIVGASLAGLRAAESAREAGFSGRITMIGSEKHLPYDRPPLSKAFLAENAGLTPDELPLLRPAHTLDDLGVELLLGEPAAGLDTVTRTLHVGPDPVAYDALIISTGATARMLGDGTTTGIRALRTVDDARAIKSALDRRADVVVVGAGFIGLELASAALKRGLQLTVVEASRQPLARSIGPQAAELLIRVVRESGVNLMCDRTITDIQASDGQVTGLILDDGTALPADLVVCGIGASPTVEWLTESGLLLDDGIVCDPGMATSVPGVWAAGDVARIRRADGTSLRVEHWTAAAEEGAVAGANVAAYLTGVTTSRDSTSVPYFWSELFGSKFQMLGTAARADRSELIGDADGPWMMLYGRLGRTTGVLTRDMPSRIMKFNSLVAGGSDFALAVEKAVELSLAPARERRASVMRQAPNGDGLRLSSQI